MFITGCRAEAITNDKISAWAGISSPGDSSRVKFPPGLNETDPGLKFLPRNHSLYFTRILIFGQAENSAQPENFPCNNPVSIFRSNGLNYLLAGISIEVKFGLKFRVARKSYCKNLSRGLSFPSSYNILNFGVFVATVFTLGALVTSKSFGH